MENNSTSSNSPLSATGSRIKAPSYLSGSVLIAIGIAGVFFLCSILAALAIRSVDPASFTPHPKVMALLLSQAAAELALIPFLLVALPMAWRTSLRRLGFVAPKIGDIGAAVAGGLLMILVVNGLASAIVAVFHLHHEEMAVTVLKGLKTPSETLFFSAYALLMVPVIEELVFRVFAFNAVLRLGGFWTAAAISAALFGLAHWDLPFFLPLTLGGIILCAVYFKTKNAWMSMISHAMFNVFALLAQSHGGVK